MSFLKVCGSLLVRKRVAYFGLFESFLFLEVRDKKMLLERRKFSFLLKPDIWFDVMNVL